MSATAADARSSITSDHAARTIVFAGGGSGGHLSPGLAIAERIADLAPEVSCVFFCSTRNIDATMLQRANVRYYPIPARGASRRPANFVRFVLAYRNAKREAARLLRTLPNPRMLTLGGFVAAPCAAAAKVMGVHVTLLNLDDPPGRANRWIARRADAVLSATPVSQPSGFASEVVGLPLRRAVIASMDAGACREHFGLAADAPTLLVTGASQGAATLNAVVPALTARHGDWFADWQVLHLAGADREDDVRAAYQRAGVRAAVLPFVHEMGAAWGAADLVISRAGANSVAEIAANAVPAIFLPYPYHADQHQRRNALPLVECGGAVLVDDLMGAQRTLSTLATSIEPLLRDADRRTAMRESLRALRRTDAAEYLAARLIEPSSP